MITQKAMEAAFVSEYNGWRNYETWLVKTWLDNDEPTYRYWRFVADELDDRNALADRLQAEIEEDHPLPDAGLYVDMLNAAFGEVDWQEIASSMLEDIKEARDDR